MQYVCQGFWRCSTGALERVNRVLQRHRETATSILQSTDSYVYLERLLNIGVGRIKESTPRAVFSIALKEVLA
jgi:hypothetical protein